MVDPCPRCGRGFVQREPFVRAETLAHADGGPFGVGLQTVTTGFFHLSCAPWGDPRYRITRPERRAI